MNLALYILIALFVVIFLSFTLISLIGAPYVPSFRKEVYGALTKLYELKKDDVLVDLGSGDGKVLRVASELGAKRAIGIELNLFLVLYSRWSLRKHKNCEIAWRNIEKYQLPQDTSVVYVFCEDRDLPKYLRYLRREVERLQHPLYLISHAFQAKDMQAVKSYRAYFLYKIELPK